MKNNILKISLFVVFTNLTYSQVGVGNITVNTDASILLDINSATGKGLLAPRIPITNSDLTSTSTPVANPADGLFIYNSDTSATPTNLNGYYLRNDSLWELISTENNKSSDLMLNNGYSPTAISFTPTSTYADFPIFPTVFVNNISGSIINGASSITLPKGSYDITFTLNLSGAMGATTGLNAKAIHTISYALRFVENTTNTVVSNEFIGNYAANANNSGRHILVAKVSVKLSQTTTIKPQFMRNTSNSTYSGALNYTAGSLHIFRSITK